MRFVSIRSVGFVLGLGLLAGSGARLAADPLAAGCPCTDESQATTTCKTGLLTCESEMMEAKCIDVDNREHFMVKSFPKECLALQRK